jgi:hypothetical protein
MRQFTQYRTLAALAVVLALALPGALWGQTSSGNLKGRVIDNAGEALPGATVTASNPATGLERVETTGVDGRFRFLSLPIGTYRVTVDLSGFAQVVVENVLINVATEREIEIDLSQATVEETITVTDESPLVATTPSIGTVVSQEELENLPLNGRQFANLGALAPGTTLSANTDPTKPGQLTIQLGGGIGRNVNYLIDGGDNTDDTIGGALQNFNIEAVQEFKIQTSQYKAEFGRSSGGVLSVVTKTGTNQFKGSLLGFYRDDSLAEKTETQKLNNAEKPPFERWQYGASFGGPIIRDKAHFFATWEKTELDRFSTVATGLYPAVDGSSILTPFEDELGTAKATLDISARQLLQVRYGFQENVDVYGIAPNYHPSAWGTLTNEYESILAGHTAQVGSDMLNEFIFQWTSFDNSIAAATNLSTLLYPGGVLFGQNPNTPQATTQRKYQYRDDFSFSRFIAGDPHDFKVGANYIHEPTLAGDFSSGTNGVFTLADDVVGAPVVDITFQAGSFNFSTPIDQYSVYLQDDWSVHDRLTLNLGVRYDYWEGFDLDQRSNAIWQTLSTQTRFNEYYLQDFQGGRAGVLENDDDNIAPRIGFTYDLKGDGAHLLRGGYGTFYDFPYTNATILFPTGAVLSAFGTVYNHNNPNGIRNPDGSFFQPGQPLPPNQITSPTLEPAPNEVASPTLATPYSDQLSLGYSWQVNPWLGLNIDAMSVDYHDIPYRFRANPFIPGTGARRFSDFGNFRIWYGGGRASYDGINLSGRVRTSRFEAQGFYTYSEAEGNVVAGADEFRLTDGGHEPSFHRAGADVSINPLDPQCGACFGPLNTDTRHRVTLGMLYHAPWGMNISSIARYRSAPPYTLHTAVDINGDGFRDLDPRVSRVNSERGESFSQVDLRLSKEFRFADFGVEVIGEMFNVLDEKNPTAFSNVFVPGNPLPIGLEPSAYAGDQFQGEQRLIQLGLRLSWR